MFPNLSANFSLAQFKKNVTQLFVFLFFSLRFNRRCLKRFLIIYDFYYFMDRDSSECRRRKKIIFFLSEAQIYFRQEISSSFIQFEKVFGWETLFGVFSLWTHSWKKTKAMESQKRIPTIIELVSAHDTRFEVVLLVIFSSAQFFNTKIERN